MLWTRSWQLLQRSIPTSRLTLRFFPPLPILQATRTTLQAGDAPDILFGKPQTMTEFVEGGYFMDLTGQPCLENVLPILVDECTVNGGVYGFPIDAQVRAPSTTRPCLRRRELRFPKPRRNFWQPAMPLWSRAPIRWYIPTTLSTACSMSWTLTSPAWPPLRATAMYGWIPRRA